MKILRPRLFKAYIPTASMADIVFMLIIFFVLTTTFTVDKTAVALPASLNRAEAEQESALVMIHVIREEGVPRMVFRYSEGMFLSWQVGREIPVGEPPDWESAYVAVRAEILPDLNRDVRCTLRPDSNLVNADGTESATPCNDYMRQRSPRYPLPDTALYNDMVKSLASKRFIVKADHDVPYRFVDPVIQVLRDNNAYEVFLLTEEKTVG